MLTALACIAAAIVGSTDQMVQPFRAIYGPTVHCRVSSTQLTLQTDLSFGRLWQVSLETPSGLPGGYAGVPQIHQQDIQAVVQSYNQDSSAFAYASSVAGTWGAPNRLYPDALSYGGDYRWSDVPGDSVTMTIPVSARTLGLRTLTAMNGGFMIVRLDGAGTYLDRLKTASQYVAAGLLSPTTLKENGGTLDASEKLLDLYTAYTNRDAKAILADELPAGPHKLTLICSGYKEAAAQGSRAYVTGMAWTQDGYTSASPGAELWAQATLNPYWSAHEPVFYTRPVGAVTPLLIGKVHGYEVPDGVELYVDGVLTTPVSGTTLSGKSIRIVVRSRLRHPETGEMDVATMRSMYLLTSQGLLLDNTIDYLVPTVLTEGYSAMLPVAATAFTQAIFDTTNVDYNVSPSDGARVGQVPASTVVLWGGHVASALYCPVPEEAADNWARSKGLNMWIERRATGYLRKVYMTRDSTSSPPEVLKAGDRFHSAFYILSGFFADPQTMFSKSGKVGGALGY